MKLKRFLSLAVSLAMVLSIVPAFSLTASAAEETVLFDATSLDRTSTGDIALSEGNWSGDNAGVAFNNNWGNNTGTWGSNGPTALMFFRTGARQNGQTETRTATYNGASVTAGATKITISFRYAIQEVADCYQTWYFRDVDGNRFARFYGDKNTGSGTASVGLNTQTTFIPSGGTLGIRGQEFSIVATQGASNWTVEYYQGTTLLGSDTVASINGFGSIQGEMAQWNTQYAASAMQGLKITYEVPETIKSVTATYVNGDEVISTQTKTYDSSLESGATFEAVNDFAVNGHNFIYDLPEVTLSENDTVEVTVQENWAADMNYAEVNGTVYKIESGNLVPNGNFANGLTGWYTSAGKDASTGAFTANADGTVHATGHTGATGNDSLFRGWAVEAGKKYLFTFTSSTTNEYLKVSNQDAISTSDSGNVGTGVTGTNNFVFDATAEYLVINFRWLGSNTTLGHFGLYEVSVVDDPSTVKATTTINFVDGNGTALQAAETVAGFVGDEIDLTVVAPETITYEGNLYSKDDTNAAIHTVDTTADVVNVTYTTDAVTAITEVPTATVIGTNTPVLPTTLKAETGSGSEVDVTVTAWDTSSLVVGENTVYGTVEGTTLKAEAKVTVLEETFTLADSNSVNNQPGNVVYFPVEITDEFHMEFDYTINQIKDVSVQMGYNGTLFSAGALGISPNGNQLKVTGGNKAGAGEGIVLFGSVSVGQTYHMFLTMDASDDTYTLTVTAPDGTVATTGEKGFRIAHDAINTMTLLTNGGGAEGDITVSNIKVNSTVAKTEYTFNVTKDGETTSTTDSFWSDEEALASIPDIEGYEKDVTTNGTTIYVVYSNTKDVTVTFVDANEKEILVVNETVKTDEDITVPAQEVYVLETAKLYAIPETVTATSKVVVVEEVANKYPVIADAFHNASDAQPWNNDENMLFVGSAGVTNTADTDANGENVTNKTDGGNLGSARVALVKFNVPEVGENQAVKLHVYAAKANQNLGNGNWMKIAANVSAVEANEVENAYVAGDLANLEGMVWSDNSASAKAEPVDGRMAVDEWMEIDVTNFVKAATGDTITFALYAPTAGFYVADREKAVAGGAYQGKAAYLSLEDAFVVTETGFATLTKNGSAMTTAYAVAGDDVRLVADGAVVVNTDAGYYEANKNLNLTEAVAFENTVPAALGLAMVGGAQVRIGATEIEDGAKLDAQADSGLRFLATANYSDTVLADDAVEFGIKVTAEASDKAAYVKAETFQNGENNVFSAAITNLKESNYNRKYTATAYAKVPMADGSTLELTAGEVTRSIYQVSAGIMKNGSADADNAAYTVDGVVKNILNAYVNQTGIRLSYTADGITVEDGKYTGDVFFTVESVSDGDDGFNVTITPDTSWGTPAEIAEWWMDYVRFNNNNSVAKGYISANYYINSDPVFVHEDGTLTFNFDTTDDGTGGFDGPGVPIG